ncbi:MAG: hypothetical protein IKV55_04220 [Oscillospiraceae bacterium]|nr:hypothetical protein [Oscillospiraceae bacterium]
MNAATLQMQTILDNVRSTFEAAERDFEISGSFLEKRSADNRWDADMSTNLSLLHETKEITVKLYTSHEACILSLDEQCRPLAAEAETVMLQRVARLIEQINRETRNLGANIGGTVNGSSIGTIGKLSFSPSIAAQSAESFWQTQVALRPDAAEAKKKVEEEERAARQAKRDEERRIRDEERNERSRFRNLKSANAKVYREQAKIWEKAYEYKEALTAQLDSELAIRQREIEAQCAMLRAEQVRLRKERNKCGLFDMEARAPYNEKINQLEMMQLNMRSTEAVEKFKTHFEEVCAKETQRYRDELIAYTNKRWPYFAARAAHAQKQKEKIKKSGKKMSTWDAEKIAYRILLDAGVALTIDEIREQDIRFAEYSDRQMYTVVNEMYAHGYGDVEKYGGYGQTASYDIKLEGEYLAETVEGAGGLEVATQDPNWGEDKIPPMPNAAAFFAKRH